MGFLGNLFGHKSESTKPGESTMSGAEAAKELDQTRAQNQAEISPQTTESAMASPEAIQQREANRAKNQAAQEDASQARREVLEANSGEMKVVKPENRYGGREMGALTSVTAEVPPVSDTPPTSAPETAPKPTDVSGITAPPATEKPMSAQPEAADTNPTPSTPEDTPPSDQQAA